MALVSDAIFFETNNKYEYRLPQSKINESCKNLGEGNTFFVQVL